MTKTAHARVVPPELWGKGAVLCRVINFQPLFNVFELRQKVALKYISPASMMGLQQHNIVTMPPCKIEHLTGSRVPF